MVSRRTHERADGRRFAARGDQSLAASFHAVARMDETPGHSGVGMTIVDGQGRSAALALLAKLDVMRAESDEPLLVEELRRAEEFALWRASLELPRSQRLPPPVKAAEHTGVRTRPSSRAPSASRRTEVSVG